MPQKQSHRNRPAQGPANQIAATFSEQLARAQAGQPIDPLPEQEARRLAATLSAYPDLFKTLVTALIQDDAAEAIILAIRAAETRLRSVS